MQEFRVNENGFIWNLIKTFHKWVDRFQPEIDIPNNVCQLFKKTFLLMVLMFVVVPFVVSLAITTLLSGLYSFFQNGAAPLILGSEGLGYFAGSLGIVLWIFVTAVSVSVAVGKIHDKLKTKEPRNKKLSYTIQKLEIVKEKGNEFIFKNDTWLLIKAYCVSVKDRVCLPVTVEYKDQK